jgi:hypothetical protein
VMGCRQLLGIRRRAEAKLGDGLEAGRAGVTGAPAPSIAAG